MRAFLGFLSGLVLGWIFRPLRIDPRRRTPMLEPYRYRMTESAGRRGRPLMRLLPGAIWCSRCGRTSYYDRDREEVYCAHCHLFGQLEGEA
jgi:ribosomal protein L37E